MEQAEANAELEMPALMKKEMEDASQIRRKGGEARTNPSPQNIHWNLVISTATTTAATDCNSAAK